MISSTPSHEEEERRFSNVVCYYVYLILNLSLHLNVEFKWMNTYLI